MIRKIKTFLKNLGPGLITGASDDDPSGIVTYTQAGAQYGLATLWTALLTLPLMICIQEMCARIALVTNKSLTTIIKTHYPSTVLYLIIFLSFPAIIFNIGANIASMGAVANLLCPIIPAFIFTILFTFSLIMVNIFLSYKRIESFLKYLCLSLIFYILTPFLNKQDWAQIIRSTFIPHIHFNKEFITIMVAILGTTISPYMFFWQTILIKENENHKQKLTVINKKSLGALQRETSLGMIFSNITMYFIILTSGTVLFQNGIFHIDNVRDAAQALQPLSGNFAVLFFSLGILGTGLLSIPVLSNCLAYMMAEALEWDLGLDKKYSQAWRFYSVMIIALMVSVSLNFIGLSPINALIYTAILYGIISPILILLILLMGNNKKIMGKFTNSVIANIFGLITLALMTMATFLLFYI